MNKQSKIYPSKFIIKSIFFVLILLISFNINSQSIKCDDLIQYAKTEGYRKGSVSSYSLINSSWLKGVEAYSIDDIIIVIAEIKRDEWGYNTKKYIFCGISNSNWNAFYYGTYDYGKTYGERFHKYIFDFQCDCY